MEHDIGSKIKAARIEKKLTQEQVAELLGVSRQTISNWENEKSYPDIIIPCGKTAPVCSYSVVTGSPPTLAEAGHSPMLPGGRGVCTGGK